MKLPTEKLRHAELLHEPLQVSETELLLPLLLRVDPDQFSESGGLTAAVHSRACVVLLLLLVCYCSLTCELTGTF